MVSAKIKDFKEKKIAVLSIAFLPVMILPCLFFYLNYF